MITKLLRFTTQFESFKHYDLIEGKLVTGYTEKIISVTFFISYCQCNLGDLARGWARSIYLSQT